MFICEGALSLRMERCLDRRKAKMVSNINYQCVISISNQYMFFHKWMYTFVEFIEGIETRECPSIGFYDTLRVLVMLRIPLSHLGLHERILRLDKKNSVIFCLCLSLYLSLILFVTFLLQKQAIFILRCCACVHLMYCNMMVFHWTGKERTCSNENPELCKR